MVEECVCTPLHNCLFCLLVAVCYHHALPFVGFGFLDNFIMITVVCVCVCVCVCACVCSSSSSSKTGSLFTHFSLFSFSFLFLLSPSFSLPSLPSLHLNLSPPLVSSLSLLSSSCPPFLLPLSSPSSPSLPLLPLGGVHRHHHRCSTQHIHHGGRWNWEPHLRFGGTWFG